MGLLLPSPNPALGPLIVEELEGAYAAIQSAFGELSKGFVTGQWVDIPYNQADVFADDPSTYVVPPDFGGFLSYKMIDPTTMLYKVAIVGATLTAVGSPTQVNLRLPTGFRLGVPAAGDVYPFQVGFGMAFNSTPSAGFAPVSFFATNGQRLVRATRNDFSPLGTNDFIYLLGTVVLRVFQG